MKQYFNLQGQVAVVTGASTGLGLQMAKALANQGANLVLLARRMNLLEANAESISREYGVEVLPLQCDITVTEQVKAAVAATMERFGKIDILINNAGTGAVAPAEEITDEQFKHEMEVDLFGTFVCAREVGKEMIKAGYGDIIGKYSCLVDWKLSAFINNEYFCKKVYNLTYKCANSVKRLASKIKNRDEKAIGKLMEGLVLVGVLMSFVGSSRPASGSEHHLSHYFEITGILDNTEYFAHGIDVVYSATFLARLKDKMLTSNPKKVEFNKEQYVKDIERIYTKSASEVIKLQEKLGWYYKDDSAFIYSNWAKIKKIIKKSPSFSKFNKMVTAVGLDYTEFEKLYSKEKLDGAILYAKDLKDRYTVLWLYYDYFR